MQLVLPFDVEPPEMWQPDMNEFENLSSFPLLPIKNSVLYPQLFMPLSVGRYYNDGGPCVRLHKNPRPERYRHDR